MTGHEKSEGDDKSVAGGEPGQLEDAETEAAKLAAQVAAVKAVAVKLPWLVSTVDF
jgi:hypothetical protein